jgi:uncharacterized membrane protein
MNEVPSDGPPERARGPRRALKIGPNVAGKVGGEALHRAEKVGSEALHAAERVGGEALHAAHVLREEPFWQAQAALVGALILYLTLPSKLVVGPGWLMPALELMLIGGLWFDRPRLNRTQARRERTAVLVLLGMVAIANAVSLELLVHYLLHGGKAAGRPLILASIVIWLTNVAVFALWYWQLDRGGPDRRARGDAARPDFLFPQMTEPELTPMWSPSFLDYLYTSFTNSTALSPTDTMPVSIPAKMLMMVQSMISLVTVLLVGARAVNILS